MLRDLGLAAALLGAILTAGCGETPSTATTTVGESGDWENMGPSTVVTLPDGYEVTAELKISPQERGEGMMYRSSLPVDKGMLFILDRMEPQGFWMYNTYVPLDIIWMDDTRQVVEISANTPPCGDRDARNCPSFGGSVPAIYVLELAAGQAALHGVQMGTRLDF